MSNPINDVLPVLFIFVKVNYFYFRADSGAIDRQRRDEINSGLGDLDVGLGLGARFLLPTQTFQLK